MHHPYLQAIRDWSPVEYHGAVTKIANGIVHADGPVCSVGDYCEIDCRQDGEPVLAEVITVGEKGVGLSPLHPVTQLRLGARVRQNREHLGLPVGDAFAGRAVNALARPIDGKAAVATDAIYPRQGMPPAMLDRCVRKEQLVTGLKAIDALFPLAMGQRIGIFAASGVGKTSLVDQLSRQVECDHAILCLVGERGREAEHMWRTHLAEDDGDRFTLVAATSDESASLRVRAVEQSLALAEYWRSRGKHVVLFVDSITRLALALREIGLAAGEPPTIRAYTPNIFSALPKFVERCGADRKGGSITAIFTVLSETDDQDDPLVELMKSLLDGHIILSRGQADRGIFPAIDIGASISRCANDLQDGDAHRQAETAHRVHVDYQEARPMVESGLYQKGASRTLDQAIELFPRLVDFVRQPMDEYWPLARTRAAIAALFGSRGRA